jgi:acyl-CoA synthetase (AMP-forming)/AMP-acid ligase II
VAVENALYADPRVLEAAAVGVPDERLGELVVAIVSLRPAYKGQVTEEELISQSQTRFVLRYITQIVFKPSNVIHSDFQSLPLLLWL